MGEPSFCGRAAIHPITSLFAATSRTMSGALPRRDLVALAL